MMEQLSIAEMRKITGGINPLLVAGGILFIMWSLSSCADHCDE